MTIDFPDGLGQITYEFDYFAGSNVLVYAQHVLIDDCVRIGWNVQQNRQPIWGYASQYFNALASGVVMVNGSLWIAFKEVAYMPAILSEAFRVMQGGGEEEADNTEASPPTEASANPWGSGRLSIGGESLHSEPTTGGSGRISAGGEVIQSPTQPNREQVETLVQATEDSDQSLEVARSLAQVVTALGAASDEEFEDIAERFEDVVWGPDAITLGNATTVSSDLPRRVDQYPPIDLLVTFGDMHTAAANHTVCKLCNVSFVNTEYAAIEPTGEPILVRYDFVARTAV